MKLMNRFGLLPFPSNSTSRLGYVSVCCIFSVGFQILPKEPLLVPVKMKNPDDSEQEVQLPVLLPHKILEYLILECGFHIDDQLVRKYWQGLEESQHELAVKTGHFRRLVDKPVLPLGIHGDEASMAIISAPYDKIYGVFLNVVLFRPTTTRLSRFLLFSVDSSRVWSLEDTMYPLLEEIKNSLNFACETGVAGRRFLVSELRGDQAWFRYILRHRSWWLTREVCFKCKASIDGGHNCYTNYDIDLGPRTTEQFILEELPQDGLL